MNNFDTLQQIILTRRSVKPGDMNGQKIADETIVSLLELGHWAPTHARTEPWRFVVNAGAGVAAFCANHAELYKHNTDPESFTQAKYDNLLHMGDKVSHIVAVYMKRVEGAKIPVIEDIAATAAAMENVLLGAQAQGIAVLWSTGGMVHQPAMKTMLGLGADDNMMGLVYMGYTDLPAKEGKRNTTLQEKMIWNAG